MNARYFTQEEANQLFEKLGGLVNALTAEKPHCLLRAVSLARLEEAEKLVTRFRDNAQTDNWLATL